MGSGTLALTGAGDLFWFALAAFAMLALGLAVKRIVPVRAQKLAKRTTFSNEPAVVSLPPARHNGGFVVFAVLAYSLIGLLHWGRAG